MSAKHQQGLIVSACLQALENLNRQVDALGLPAVRLVWLMSCINSPSEEQLDSFAKFGTHIGPDKVGHDI